MRYQPLFLSFGLMAMTAILFLLLEPGHTTPFEAMILIGSAVFSVITFSWGIFKAVFTNRKGG